MAFPESGIFSGVSTSITDVNCHLTLTKGKKNLITKAFQCKNISQDPGLVCICILFVIHKCRTEVNDSSIDFAIYIEDKWQDLIR